MGINENAGESIVVHIGNGNWIVIDSCKTQQGLNLPLYYLDKIKVPKENVVRVACTHLHSDHINGLSEVLDNSPNARFCFSLIGDEKSMIYILAQYKLDKSLPNGGTFGEFMRCIDVVKKKKLQRTPIGFDQPIYTDGTNQVQGISPSIQVCELYLAKLLKYNIGEPIPSKMLKTNFCSVASIIMAGNVKAILGADLEASRPNNADINSCLKTCQRKSKHGWCNAIKQSQYFPLSKYSYIKIPHHSSDTGFCPLIWNSYMDDYSVATSTVFSQGSNNLPEQKMVQAYTKCASEYYLTSIPPVSKKDKTGRGVIDEKKGTAYDDMTAVQEKIGIITSRRTIGTDRWKTEFYESAIKIK